MTMKDTQKTTHPSWWKDDMHSAWDRVKDSMQRDWEQTRREFGDKTAADVKKAKGTDASHGPRHDQDALRFGFGAAHADKYREEKTWSDGFAVKLRQEWDDLKSGRTWDEVKDAVRVAFEKTRNAARS